MTWTIKTYRRLSVLLWGAVSVVVGVSAAVYWQMDSKGVLFMAILSGGAYLLYLLRRQGKGEGVLGEDKENWEEEMINGSKNETINQAKREKLFDEKGMEKESEIIEDELDKNKVREWLDDFLVKQQEK